MRIEWLITGRIVLFNELNIGQSNHVQRGLVIWLYIVSKLFEGEGGVGYVNVKSI